jgi:dihydrofolate reductase
MPKYVISSTLTDPSWNNTTVLTGDLASELERLKREVDGDISVAGSVSLVQSLFALDLVDELHLMQFPVILGYGQRLWGDTPDKLHWELTRTTTFGDGVLVTEFRRAR